MENHGTRDHILEKLSILRIGRGVDHTVDRVFPICLVRHKIEERVVHHLLNAEFAIVIHVSPPPIGTRRVTQLTLPSLLIMCLRHAGFDSEQDLLNAELLNRNYDEWILFGFTSAIFAWEADGLKRVAQWSSTMGLHVYTEEMHKNCLRIVCPLLQARIIVEAIRNIEQEPA